MKNIQIFKFKYLKAPLVLLALLFIGFQSVNAGPKDPITTHVLSVSIVLDKDANDIEKRAANVLKSRLQKYSKIVVDVVTERSSAELQIYLGKTGHNGQLDKLCAEQGLELPQRVGNIFAEGFAVKSLSLNNQPTILMLAADDRAVMYSIGEVIRQMTFKEFAIAFNEFDVRTAPAFRFRGYVASQGIKMLRATGVRGWGDEDRHRLQEEYMLAGGNTSYGYWTGGDSFVYAKAFGMMTERGTHPDAMEKPHPEEWTATLQDEWEYHTNEYFVCTSIPEAREALLKNWERRFNDEVVAHDIFRFFSGDAGGCKCDLCAPWGKTYVDLSNDLAKIIKKRYPDSYIILTNQHLSNEGDQAIFDYLNEEPRPWLDAMGYGPGSNAMSLYFRDEGLRDDLFEYPGKGPINRYLVETLNQIPASQGIVHYSDITHFTAAQYGMENPDPYVIKAYARRTFHARPRDYYKIFQAIMPLSQGDLPYCEGYHDDMNQYLWQRLLWNPNQTAEEVYYEYSRLFFGPEAADLMTEAIFQLEVNFEAPLQDNEGISRYYGLVKEAGKVMPAHIKEKSHRWHQHMEKAALDKYNQEKLRGEFSKEERVRNILNKELTNRELDATINKALIVLNEPAETTSMAKYREEAKKHGDKTAALYSIRNVGFFKLDSPLRDINGIKKLLETAKNSKKDKRELINSAIELSNKVPTVRHH